MSRLRGGDSTVPTAECHASSEFGATSRGHLVQPNDNPGALCNCAAGIFSTITNWET